MRFLLFIFMFGSSVTYGRSYNVLYPLSEDEVPSASSMASAKGEGLRTLSEDSESLFEAVRRNDVKKVKKLLNKEANPNEVSPRGNPILHLVESPEMAKVFLDAGADPNAKDADGNPILHFVESPEMAKVLIDRGADPNAKDADGNPMLRLVESPEMAKVLIDRGADPNAKDADGNPMLHLVESPEMAKVLIDGGANSNAKLKNGYTALHLPKNSRVAEVLLDAGAKLDAKTSTGLTPLHISVMDGSVELTRLYLEKGADPNAKDKYGQTPSDYADNKEIKEILRAAAEASCKGAFNR